MTPTNDWKYNYKEVLITINQRGSFDAEVEGERLNDDRLDGLKAKVDAVLVANAKQRQQNLALEVLAIQTPRGGYYDRTKVYPIVATTIKGIHRSSGDALYAVSSRDHRMTHVCANVPGAREALVRLQAAMQELVEAEKLTDSFGFDPDKNGMSISPEKYPQAVEGLLQRYKKAVAERWPTKAQEVQQ